MAQVIFFHDFAADVATALAKTFAEDSKKALDLNDRDLCISRHSVASSGGEVVRG